MRYVEICGGESMQYLQPIIKEKITNKYFNIRNDAKFLNQHFKYTYSISADFVELMGGIHHIDVEELLVESVYNMLYNSNKMYKLKTPKYFIDSQTEKYL